MQNDLTNLKDNPVFFEKLQILNENQNLNYNEFCAILFQKNPNSLKQGFFSGCIRSNEETTLSM